MEMRLPPGAPRSFWKSAWGAEGRGCTLGAGSTQPGERSRQASGTPGPAPGCPLTLGPLSMRRGNLAGARVRVSGGCHHGHPSAVEKQALKGLQGRMPGLGLSTGPNTVQSWRTCPPAPRPHNLRVGSVQAPPHTCWAERLHLSAPDDPSEGLSSVLCSAPDPRRESRA